MPLRDNAALAALISVSGCSGGWWHDAPSVDAPPISATDTGYSAGQPTGGSPATPYDGTAYPQPNRSYPVERSARPRPTQQLPADVDYTPPPTMTVKYDNVGLAVWSAQAGTVAGAHASLPPGAFVEVTSLDTGKTILVPITATSRPGREIELSGAAAQELGLGMGGGQAPVRVRTTNPTGADIGALKAGRPAPPRPDTPPVLLNALRRKLSGTIGQAGAQPGYIPVQSQPNPPQRPAIRPDLAPSTVTRPPIRTAPPAAARAAAVSGYYVQIAAFADPAQAEAAAHQSGGAMISAGGQYRVRFGPFDDVATAQAARDEFARRGYAEARIVHQD